MAEIALPASDPRGSTAMVPARLPGGPSPFDRLRSFTRDPAVAKSLPMIGLVAILGLAVLIWVTMAQPAQRNLFAGLADADKAAVAEALTAADIAYALDSSTGALTVAEDSFHQAKMLLAQQGLPKSAPDGDTMISALPMGASRAVEGERLRGARELDLARTIEAIDAVETAKVHLAVEAPSVFVRDEARAGASVMLRLRPGRALSDAQVQAIVHLVASSVPGLAPDGVSIVDQAGRLLSSAGGGAGGEAGSKQLDLQNRVEARYTEALAKLLTPLVGAGNYTAEVHADLDFAETQATRESFPKDNQAIRAEQGGWTADPKQGEASGIPGALSNTAPPATQVAAAPNGVMPAPGEATEAAAGAAAKTSETFNRTFELGREVSVTRQPVGSVRRLSVAVAIKQGARRMTAAELSAIENLVKGAVGYDQTRGDMIAFSQRSFAVVEEDAATAAKWWDAPWVALVARNVSALLIAALLVFGIAKPLMKRRAAAAAEPAANPSAGDRQQLRGEIAHAITEELRADPSRPVTLDMIEAAPGYSDRAALIRNFVRQDPSRAALVVRDLIRSDMPGGADGNG